MKHTSLLLLVLLAGCSLSPLAELEDYYFQCTSDGAQGCNLIAEEIDRRYELVARQERHKLARCSRIDVTCRSGEQAGQYLRELDRAIFERY
jgi:hypothetical protein